MLHVLRGLWIGSFAGAALLGSTTAGFAMERSRNAADAATQSLHGVAWGNVTLPGSACEARRPIAMHNGSGFVSPIPRHWSSAHFYGKRGVTVSDGPSAVVVYGELAGTGNENAGLQVLCSNGGGTADGQLLWDWVIFSDRDRRLSVVGVVKPKVQAPHEHATLLQIIMKPGELIAHEFFYGPYDGTCCSSGRATTIWTYSHGVLRASTPVITRRPRTSPVA
jgi:hypothetical protein